MIRDKRIMPARRTRDEFKYDGYRALCYIEAGRDRFMPQRGKIMTRFNTLGDQVAVELGVGEPSSTVR